jgi:hypothetical protein
VKRGRIGAVLLVLSGVAACAGAPPGRGARASSTASCPPGAEPGRTGCVCRRDLHPVLGGCVSVRTAAAFCGPTAQPTETGCAPQPPCDPGRARALGSGACLPRREVRAMAVGLGILVGDDELVGCPGGGLLVAEGDGAGGPSRLGCIAQPVFPGQDCPPGSVPGGPKGTCQRVFDGRTVDVAEWARAVLGGDGPDSSPLCKALARGPGALGPPRSGAVVSLVFPDNDVSLVRFSATAELEGALSPMVEALRGLGGTARQAALSVRAVCRPAPRAQQGQAERPSVLTPENDHEK